MKRQWHTKSDTRTSPLTSSDICGFDGAPGAIGKATIGEFVSKWRGSPGTVATSEQLGEPNYEIAVNVCWRMTGWE